MTTLTHEQNVVLQIQRDNGVDEESLRAIEENLEMGRTISNLQKMLSVTTELLSNELYTKPAHCVLEILQNADDNLYDKNKEPELRIKLRANSMEIACNEIGFQDAHVRAFCGIRQSTKTNQAGYIGEKGIGAKSIFKVARRVTIQSGEYAFELDKERKLGMITPVWAPGLPSTPGWTTMRLELVDKSQFNVLKDQLLESRSTVLLFLRKLNKLVVDDGTTFNSTKSITGNIINLTTRITSRGAGEQLVSDRYLRVARDIPAARDDEKRQGQTSTAIILAFPLNPDDEPLSTPSQMVYAFLPLRQAGFRFLLQADFLTAANREDILTDREWNVVIRDAVAASFVASVAMFKASLALQHTWFRFLPREHEVAHPFFAPIVDQINTQLRKLPIVWTSAENWRVPSKCTCTGHFTMMTADDNNAPLVQPQYLDYAYVSDVYVPDVLNILSSLGVRDLSYADFLEGLRRMHAAGVFTTQPPDWLEDVCDKILMHGIRRGKRKDQLFENEAGLRWLPLAQRRDGSWSNCQERQVSTFFIDASGSSFPSGLSIEILNMDNLGPRRQQLLRLLGVQDVNVSLVVEKILSIHRSNSVSVQDVLSHLQYLFRNRHSYPDKMLPTTLWLVEATGKRPVRCANAYMESTAAVAEELRLETLFGSDGGGRFLHASLISEGSTPADNQQWRNWLVTSLGVATAPRLKPSGRPSPELENIIKSNRLADVSKLLSILDIYWADMLVQSRSPNRQATESDFYKYFSNIQVRCANGKLEPLHSTYFLSASIEQFAAEDLPILPVPDASSDWSWLRKCGVSFDINANFFLKRLRNLAAKDARTIAVPQANQLYRHIESRFHEQPQAIRSAFRQEPLILIGGSWRIAEHVVWDGPSILTLKHRLQPTYPNLGTFFHDHLRISDAPDDIVADELLHFALTRARQPLGHDDVERLRRLLEFGNGTMEKVEQGYMNDWTVPLSQAAILPIRKPNSKEIWLAAVGSRSFYVPDQSGVLSKVFAEKVAFIGLDPAIIFSMEPLLKRFGIDDRRIDRFVTRKVTANGVPLEHVAEWQAWDIVETSFFTNKLPLLERVYYFTTKELLPVQSALVFKVDKLNVSYMLRDNRVIVVSDVANCWSIVQDNELLIFFSATLDPQDYHNYPVAETIVSALGMRDEHVGHMRSIFYDSDRDIAHFLQRSGIHEMPDHLRQTSDEPNLDELTEASEYKNLQTVAYPEVILNATVAEVDIPQRDRQVPSPVHDASGTAAVGLGAGQEFSGWGWSQASLPPQNASITAAIGLGGQEFSGWERSQVNAEYSSSKDRPELSRLERRGEQYDLQPAVTHNASVHSFLTPLSPPRLARLWDGFDATADASTWEGAAVSPMIVQPDEQATARIGFLGENYVFQLLSKRLPGFSVPNWTSNVRVQGGHPHFLGEELADFVYQDTKGVLTSMLFPDEPKHVGQPFEYFIEVKSSSGAASEPFHFSRRQLEQAFSMTRFKGKRRGSQIYVLFRVSNVGNSGEPRVTSHVDPHRLLHQGTFRIVSDAVDVCIVGGGETGRSWN